MRPFLSRDGGSSYNNTNAPYNHNLPPNNDKNPLRAQYGVPHTPNNDNKIHYDENSYSKYDQPTVNNK